MELVYLLKMELVAAVWETRTTYFKKETHFLIDQPRTCCIFILGCIKSIFFLTNMVISLVYTE